MTASNSRSKADGTIRFFLAEESVVALENLAVVFRDVAVVVGVRQMELEPLVVGRWTPELFQIVSVELVERDLAVLIDVRFIEHFVLHFVAQTEVRP